ncbi:MAG: DMT family transporter [Selenomonadaceae bacterium]|nr:DMT family transporter [Selenomonadaceae bacterium]
MKDKTKGVLLAFSSSVMWGASGVAGEFLFTEKGMTTEWLVGVRMITSGLLLLLIDYLCNKESSIFSIFKDKNGLRGIIIFAFAGMLAVQYTYFAAIENSNAATGTVMQYMMPIIIIAWSALSNHRMPKLYETVCALMAITGTVLLVTHGDLGTLAISEMALLWGVLTAFAAAFYTVYPRWLIMRWSSTNIMGWAMFLGSLPLIIAHPPTYYIGGFEWSSFGALSYLVVFGTAIPFWAYVVSTRYILPQETGIINAVEPFSSIIFSVLFLGTIFGCAELVGAMLIIIPVAYISTRS